jgi:hypothetical protein
MGFLTKKPTNQSKQSTKQVSSTPVITAPSPLYAKYSSPSNPRPDNTGSPRKLVSTPKPLGQPSSIRMDRRQSVDRFANSSTGSRHSLANSRSQISAPVPSTPTIPAVERNEFFQPSLSTKNPERNNAPVSPAVVTSAAVAASRRLSAQQLDKPLPQPIPSTTNNGFHPDSTQMSARTRTASDARPTNTRRHSRIMADNVASQTNGPSPGQFWPPPAFAYGASNAAQTPRLAGNGAPSPSPATAMPMPQPHVVNRTPSQTKLVKPPSQRRLSGELPQPFVVPARSLDGHSTVASTRSTVTSPAGSLAGTPPTSPPSVRHI